MSTDEMTAAFDMSAFRELANGFAGELVRPLDASYDEHRKVWNGSIDRRPALIARCTGVEDISAATEFEDETAFNGRGAGHTFNIGAATATADGFDEEREWVRDFWSALEPHHTSVYVNFLMEEGEERIRQAYGAQKYDRLKALKRMYDPDNLCRLNQNIPPQ